MSSYRLDDKRKFECPSCKVAKKFTKYINTKTGEYVPDVETYTVKTEPKKVIKKDSKGKDYESLVFENGIQVYDTKRITLSDFGICDRADSCGYSNIIKESDVKIMSGFCPSDYKSYSAKRILQGRKKQQPKPRVFIPYDWYKENCYKDFDINGFINGLANNNYDLESIKQLITLYQLGTYNVYGVNYLAMPFIDINGNIATIQLKDFDTKQIKTIGMPKWVHKVVANNTVWKKPYLDFAENESVVYCLFGEHLLSTYPKNPVCLVESPKNAFIASLEFGMPKDLNDTTTTIFVATFSQGTFKSEGRRCKYLKGRNVTILPDFDAYDDWAKKAKDFKSGFHTSNFLKDFVGNDNDKRKYDIADFFLLHSENRNRYKGKVNLLSSKNLSIDTVKYDKHKQDPRITAFMNKPQPKPIDTKDCKPIDNKECKSIDNTDCKGIDTNKPKDKECKGHDKEFIVSPFDNWNKERNVYFGKDDDPCPF